MYPMIYKITIHLQENKIVEVIVTENKKEEINQALKESLAKGAGFSIRGDKSTSAHEIYLHSKSIQWYEMHPETLTVLSDKMKNNILSFGIWILS